MVHHFFSPSVAKKRTTCVGSFTMSENNEKMHEMQEEGDLEAGNLNGASSATVSDASFGSAQKHVDTSRSMLDTKQDDAQEASIHRDSSTNSSIILQERVNEARMTGDLPESRLSDHASSYLPSSLRDTNAPPSNLVRDYGGYSADTSEQGGSDLDAEVQQKHDQESQQPSIQKCRWDPTGHTTPHDRWNPLTWKQDLEGLKPPPRFSDHGYHGDTNDDEEDDGSVSSLETEDGLIAIGIPDPRDQILQDEVDPELAAPKTKEEATQHALDKVVAENIAEEEHNVKAGLKSPTSGVARRRSSIRDDRKPSADEMMEAKRLERERSRDTLDMHTRRLQRTAARQAASVEDIKVRPGEEGKALIPTRTKSHDSTDSSDSNFSYASARARASLRSREEAIKLKEQESGPSLASATSDEVLPGAFSILQQDRHEKETGPSLAPALASEMTTSGPSLAPAVADSNNDYEEEIEAQAGIPVVLPGAFAIEGMDANSSESLGYNSTAETNSLGSTEEEQIEDTIVVPQVQLPSTQAPAFEAELHEEVVVDGAVLQIDDEEDDPKVARRLRLIQVGVLCFSVAAVALVVASVVSFSDRNGDQYKEPIIEGWDQIGSDVFGLIEEKQGFFGKDLALSGDGTLLAVSAPGVDDDEKELDVGRVHIFKEGLSVNGTVEWLPEDVLDGIGSSSEAEASISLSRDGSLLAVGYPFYEGGHVQVFEDAGNGMQLTETLQTLQNASAEPEFGHVVALSSDGSVLAIGAPQMGTDDMQGTGSIHVYRSLNPSWAPMGEDIIGEEFEFIGWSVAVAMSESENVRVATGGPAYEVPADRGIAQVFVWTGSFWQKLGQKLYGEVSYDRFGESVALSEDGTVLAVGARGTLGPGKAYIFREKDGQWVLDGKPFLGEEDGEGFGASVALSSDGSVLAVGSSKNSEFGENAGRIQVWKYNDSTKTWEQEGSNIGGSEGIGFGSAVSLSADGSRVAGGAPLAEFDGSVPDNGIARVYERIIVD